MRATALLLGLFPLASIALLFFAPFPELGPGIGVRIGLAGFIFAATGFFAERLHPSTTYGSSITSALPGVVLGGLLGVFAALRPGDLAMILLLAVGALACATIGGFLGMRTTRAS